MPMDQPTAELPLPSDGTGGTMPLGDHLEELRTRVIRAGLGVILAASIAFWKGWMVIGLLQNLYNYILAQQGHPPTLFLDGPTLGFANVYLPVCLVVAAILASPWIVWQAWQFIAVGLYHNERKAVYLLAPFSTLMAMLGVAFTYFILLPVSLSFFVRFTSLYPETSPDYQPTWITQKVIELSNTGTGASHKDSPEDGTAPAPEEGATSATTNDEALTPAASTPQLPVLQENPVDAQPGTLYLYEPGNQLRYIDVHGHAQVLNRQASKPSPLPRMGEFIRFAAFMGMGMVFAFQLPVFLLVLGHTRLITPDAVRSSRKYAFFACAIAGAVLTPTDIFSMVFVMFPLYGLFEFGLALMYLSFRRAEAKAAREDQELEDAGIL